jgi:DNA-binding winged helix-turn-helix (wHTH) protein
MPTEESLADELWRVDWTNACVWHGDAMVRLPPKACAVLRLLMEQAGQLVTKEVLLEAIWPDTAVTEAVLTVCIGELRKALRESAQAPRFIQTVHRRGYRFIGHLPTVVPSSLPPAHPAANEDFSLKQLTEGAELCDPVAGGVWQTLTLLHCPREHSKMCTAVALPPTPRVSEIHPCVREEISMHPDLVVGKRLPDLVLPDHRNQPVRLSELARGFPLILSFYRGYW